MGLSGDGREPSTTENIMLSNITLEKPLAVIDLETTGTDPHKDRIVEISVLKIMPGGQRLQRTRRLNPGVPIPPEATAIHGITDADVVGEPPFEEVADRLLAFLGPCDFCGFNLKKFDLRMLYSEFSRGGRTLVLEGRALIDPMEIFHRQEPRDLPSAVRTYLGREHMGGHSAMADVLATAEVLDAMLTRYPDLPRGVAGLNQHFMDANRIDLDGFFRRAGTEIRFMKGKHRGSPLAMVATTDPGYLEWMLGQEFFEDTKGVVRDALATGRAARPAARRPAASIV
jgi:DNA polymerase III subunit epsilon